MMEFAKGLLFDLFPLDGFSCDFVSVPLLEYLRNSLYYFTVMHSSS